MRNLKTGSEQPLTLKFRITEDLNSAYLCSPASEMGTLVLAELEGLEWSILLLSSSFRLYWTKIHLSVLFTQLLQFQITELHWKVENSLELNFPHESNFCYFSSHLGFETQSWIFFTFSKFSFSKDNNWIETLLQPGKPLEPNHWWDSEASLLSSGFCTQLGAGSGRWSTCTPTEPSRGLQNGAALVQAQFHTLQMEFFEVCSSEHCSTLIRCIHVYNLCNW